MRLRTSTEENTNNTKIIKSTTKHEMYENKSGLFCFFTRFLLLFNKKIYFCFQCVAYVFWRVLYSRRKHFSFPMSHFASHYHFALSYPTLLHRNFTQNWSQWRMLPYLLLLKVKTNQYTPLFHLASFLKVKTTSKKKCRFRQM